jgi:hypothetical protein
MPNVFTVKFFTDVDIKEDAFLNELNYVSDFMNISRYQLEKEEE